MKRVFSLLLVLLMVLSLCACGNKAAVKNGVFTTTEREFSKKLGSVVAKNSDLAGIKLSEDTISETETTKTFAAYDGTDFIGTYVMGMDEGGNVKGISVVIYNYGPPAKQYMKLCTATWMTLDSNLSYEEANEITTTLEDGIIWQNGRGDSVKKNGVYYFSSGSGSTDTTMFFALPDEDEK